MNERLRVLAEDWDKENPILQNRRVFSSRANFDNGEWTVAGWLLFKLGVPLDELSVSGFAKEEDTAQRIKITRDQLRIPTAQVYLLCWLTNREDVRRMLLKPEDLLGPQSNRLLQFAKFLDGLNLSEWQRLDTVTRESYFKEGKEWFNSGIYKLDTLGSGYIYNAFLSAGHFQFAGLVAPNIIYKDLPVFDAVGLAASEILQTDEFREKGYDNFFLKFFPEYKQARDSVE